MGVKTLLPSRKKANRKGGQRIHGFAKSKKQSGYLESIQLYNNWLVWAVSRFSNGFIVEAIDAQQ